MDETFLQATRNLPAGPLMGLDLGTKTIGVAVSTPIRSLATPVGTLRRGKFMADAAQLIEMATARSVVGLIIGLPRNMDGSEGPSAQSVRAFARNWARVSALPVAFWDERLSTAAMERALIALDTSRARRAEMIDAMAATYILQGALDRLHAAAQKAAHDADDPPDGHRLA